MEINKYNNGKIYTIRSPNTDKYYIGSTCNTLTNRFMSHKSPSNKCESKEIIDLGEAYIELLENPHQVNPARGFVSSANQLPVDTTYPYYIGGHHDLYRGKMINRYLNQMSNITAADMQRLQTENYNLFAKTALPVLLKNIDASKLTPDRKSLV